jgi:predicted flap endonuclease-1-like 5' DNA nuclease
VIVLSLLLVIAAAVCLFIGLFVVTESLTFIVAAIVLCVLSLLLLWLGTRAHKKRAASTATAPSAPVYGGGARPGARVAAPPAGGVAPPVRAPERDSDDTLVVRKTDARDRAAARVASVVEDDAEVTAEPAATPVVKKAVVKKAAAAPSITTTAAEKASTKKASTKKPSAKKASTKKASAKKASTKKASTRKASAKKASTKKTTGAAARARLTEISGLGPAKQDALLKAFGNLESISSASADELAQVKGVGDALAKRIKDQLS